MSERKLMHLLGHLTASASEVARATVLRFCFSCCTVFIILWIAILMYVSFYYAYIPTVRHVRPIFLLFNSGCENSLQSELCSYPEANLSLSTGERMLMRGQQYGVFVDLEMPHSPINEKLGMFIVKLQFLSDAGKVLSSAERSCMLHYQSPLLQSLGTLFYFFPMVLGFTEEKQNVRIKMYEKYVEDSYHPAVGVHVTVMSKRIEIYSAALRIEAHFSGLRYIMINWPVMSALVVITVNFFIISMVYFFAYSAFSPLPVFEDEAQPPDLDSVTAEQQRALSTRRVGRPESGTESVSPRSRRARHGSLKPRRVARERARTSNSGGLLRCASFPCLSSIVDEIPRSLTRSGPRYHSTDVLGSPQKGDVDHECAAERRHAFEDLVPSTDARIDIDPYHVLTFPNGKVRRAPVRTYQNGYTIGAEASSSVENDIHIVKRAPGGLRYRSRRSRVFSKDSASGSSTECVHSRLNQRGARLSSYEYEKSSESDEMQASLCEYPACNEYRCYYSHECRDCGEVAIHGPLKSRVPDGATSSSEALQNWTPGGHVARAEASKVRPLSDTDQRSTKKLHKAKARFGMSFRKILSKKDDKLV